MNSKEERRQRKSHRDQIAFEEKVRLQKEREDEQNVALQAPAEVEHVVKLAQAWGGRIRDNRTIK